MLLELDKEIRKKQIETGDNPFKYHPLYWEIYQREKTYRNLKGYDHLVNISDLEPEYRSSSKDLNVIYAPKQQVPFEFDFIAVLDRIKNIFMHTENIFICGGFATSQYFLRNSDIAIDVNDIDLFIASTPEKKMTIDNVKEIINCIFEKEKEFDIKGIKQSEGAVSFSMTVGGKVCKFQFIKRLYSSPSEIIHGFDIDCTCILTNHLNQFFATERCMFSLTHQYNTVNFEKLSPSYEYRLYKYYCRGFGIFIPFLEYFKLNFVTDFRNYDKLQGAALLYFKLLNFKPYTSSIGDISDYEKNECSEFTKEDITNLEFKLTDPNEQTSNTFNKIVLDDPKEWYVTQNLPSYKHRKDYIPRGDILKLEPGNVIKTYRESYFPYRYKKEDFGHTNFISRFMRLHGQDFVMVGELPLQLFLGMDDPIFPSIHLCYIGMGKGGSEIIEFTRKFQEYVREMLKSIEGVDFSFSSHNPLPEKESIDELFKNSEIFGTSSNLETQIMFTNVLTAKSDKLIFLLFSTTKYNHFDSLLDVSNCNFLAKVLDTQKHDIFRIIMNSDEEFYSDSLGKYAITERHIFTEISYSKRKFGVAEIYPKIVEDKIEPIFTRFMNDSFKIFGDPRKVLKIYGPTNLTFFNGFGENKSRRLLILGEVHNNIGLNHKDDSNTSFDLHTWLYKLSKKLPECLDMYLESNRTRKQTSSANKKSISTFSSPLSSIEATFGGCEGGSDDKCFTSDARYHLIDIRKISDSVEGPFYEINQERAWKNVDYSKALDNFIIFCLEKSERKKNWTSGSSFKKRIQYTNGWDALAYLSGWSTKPADKIVFERCFELLAEGKSHTLKTVNFEEYMTQYTAKINKCISKVEGLDVNLFFKTLISCYFDTLSIYSALICVNMDVYFLLRYLQKFGKLERGPKGCRGKEFEISKNSIIHAGDFHSDIYCKFIKRWFQIEPVIEIKQPYSIQSVTFDEPFDFFGTFETSKTKILYSTRDGIKPTLNESKTNTVKEPNLESDSDDEIHDD